MHVSGATGPVNRRKERTQLKQDSEKRWTEKLFIVAGEVNRNFGWATSRVLSWKLAGDRGQPPHFLSLPSSLLQCTYLCASKGNS